MRLEYQSKGAGIGVSSLLNYLSAIAIISKTWGRIGKRERGWVSRELRIGSRGMWVGKRCVISKFSKWSTGCGGAPIALEI